MITIKINKNGNIKEYDFPMDWKNPKNNTTFLNDVNVVCSGIEQSKFNSLHNPKQLEFNFNG